MAGTINLTKVGFSQMNENLNLIVEENSDLRRLNINNLRVNETVSIDLQGSNEGEITPVNADTLGGYPANEYIKKDELENIKPSLSIEKNYSVVGGMEEPPNPTENMIWTKTNVEIGNTFLSSTKPNYVNNNDIWIYSGTSSTAAFDAIKIGNDTMNTIYPIYAKQYISDTWVDVTAKSYQGGEWVDWWNGELYSPGNEWTHITGGWKSRGWKYGSSSYVEIAPSLKKTDTCMEINLSSTTFASGVIEVIEDIDLTNINTLTIEFEASISGYAIELIVIDRTTPYIDSAIAIKELAKNTSGTTVNIAKKTDMLEITSASKGKYDVAIAFTNRWSTTSGGNVKIYSISMN